MDRLSWEDFETRLEMEEQARHRRETERFESAELDPRWGNGDYIDGLLDEISEEE